MAALSSRFVYAGTETTETSITRVGSSADPTGQVQSRKIVTTANTQWVRPFKAEPYVIWNPTAGANVDVTVYGVANSIALPRNDEIFMEVAYLTLNGGAPLGKIVSTTKANVLAAGSVVAADASVWNGMTQVPATLDGVAVNATLSNGNLTATHNAAVNNSGARSAAQQNVGKYYFEFTATQRGGGDCWGVLTAAGTFTNFVTNGSNCVALYSSGSIWSNGNTGLGFGGVQSGDVLGFAVDFINLKAWVQIFGCWNLTGNPISVSNPATNSGGWSMSSFSATTVSPAVGFSTSAASSVTANFGATPFIGHVPSGFTAWGASTTFDGASSNVTLSNGNLTVTHGNTTNNSGARSTDQRSSGKWYFEFIVTSQGATDYIGVLTAAGTYTNIQSKTNCAVLDGNGVSYSNNSGTTLGNIGSTNSQVIGCALDLDNDRFWFRRFQWNGSGTGSQNPNSASGGVNLTSLGGATVSPAVGFAAGVGDNSTLNCGQTTYSMAPPPGFANWPLGPPSVPFKLTATLNAPQPGLAGYVDVRVRAAKPSTTFYIDPTVVLTPAGGGTSNASTAYKSSRYTYEGTETTETSITRVGGAVDPTGQAQSRKIVATANAQWLRPFKAEPYAIWNAVNGISVTVTVCGVANATALPLNDELFMEVEYLTLSGAAPLGKVITTTKSNVLAAPAAVAADGSSWSNITPPTFTPANLTGLIGWWDAGVPASLTLAGSDILAVADQSGGSNNLAWSDFSTKPQYNATGFNSKPAFVFRGQAVGDAFKNTALPLGAGGTLTAWYVGNYAQASAGVDNPSIISYTGAGQPTDFSSPGSFTTYQGYSSPNQSFGKNGASTSAPSPINVNHRVIFTVDSGGVAKVWVDGVAGAAVAFTGNWITPGLFYVGRSKSGSAYWAGSVGEVGIAAGYSDAATVAMLDNYLANKWSLGTPFAYTPFKLTTTLSAPPPGMAGYIHVRVRAAKPGAVYYIDPKITLS